jgi:hypothetical protein
MYTPGHNEIIQDAINLLGATRLEHLFIKQQKAFKRARASYFMDGLQYPDYPCGSFKKKKERYVMSKSLCSVIKVLQDSVFFPNIFSLSYSSHNGYFSVWHAMTYDPRIPVPEVTGDIVDMIMACCKLSLLDEDGPDSFWMGFALHIIMDSYSPAHVLRHTTKDRPPTNISLEDTTEIKRQEAQIKVLAKMKSIIYSSGENTKEHLDKTVAKLAIDANIKSLKSRYDMKSLARFFAWHNQEIRDINQVRTVFNKTKIILQEFPDMTPIKLPKNHMYISRYHYFQSQSAWFHKKNDLLVSVKQAGYYDQCVKDCSVVLKLYLHALDMIERDPDSKTEIAYVFMRRVYKYMTKVTFTPHPDLP